MHRDGDCTSMGRGSAAMQFQCPSGTRALLSFRIHNSSYK
jgi:hypothetical protein